MKSFQSPILIQKTAFSTAKVEVIKLSLRRIYLHMIPDYRMQGCILTYLVAEAVIVITGVQMVREDGVHLDHGLLKNDILKCFRWPIWNGYETVSSKHYFLKK